MPQRPPAEIQNNLPDAGRETDAVAVCVPEQLAWTTSTAEILAEVRRRLSTSVDVLHSISDLVAELEESAATDPVASVLVGRVRSACTRLVRLLLRMPDPARDEERSAQRVAAEVQSTLAPVFPAIAELRARVADLTAEFERRPKAKNQSPDESNTPTSLGIIGFSIAALALSADSVWLALEVLRQWADRPTAGEDPGDRNPKPPFPESEAAN